mmetsp:Transcript_18007/g.68265  ORF Transcript_18007/g.68265 Transcript_18007/m.68265 type:complete len:242 (-) Transcript_18007:2717-3442(-)
MPFRCTSPNSSFLLFLGPRLVALHASSSSFSYVAPSSSVSTSTLYKTTCCLSRLPRPRRASSRLFSTATCPPRSSSQLLLVAMLPSSKRKLSFSGSGSSDFTGRDWSGVSVSILSDASVSSPSTISSRVRSSSSKTNFATLKDFSRPLAMFPPPSLPPSSSSSIFSVLSGSLASRSRRASIASSVHLMAMFFFFAASWSPFFSSSDLAASCAAWLSACSSSSSPPAKSSSVPYLSTSSSSC